MTTAIAKDGLSQQVARHNRAVGLLAVIYRRSARAEREQAAAARTATERHYHRRQAEWFERRADDCGRAQVTNLGDAE